LIRNATSPRARALTASGDGAFRLAPDGTLSWSGGPVARLLPGDDVLTPRIDLLSAEFLEGELREMVRRRLAAFLRDEIRRRLAPLFRARETALSGAGRGLVYQLSEALGSLHAGAVAAQRAALEPADRPALARLGIRFGTEFVYLDRLFKPAALAMRALLWSLHHGAPLPAELPPAGSPSAPRADPAFYAAIGHAVLGERVLRVDRVERLAAAARRLARQGAFAPTPELAALIGGSAADLTLILPALGYRAIVEASGVTFVARPRRRRQKPAQAAPARRRVAAGEDHPFAKLRALRLAR
jgi:ATP-dependent RNA helicase SUPV3L1/SUV3